MRVPAHDLSTQYQRIQQEVDAALQDVIDSTDFILGQAVEDFETHFAEYCSVDHCIGVGSGTAALRLIMAGLDLGEGDEVITTPFTFIGTVEPIVMAGARPVFADIDPGTFNLDPERVEAAITPDTRAIVAVHLYGQPTALDRLRELADAHDLYLIEDAAQAQGARWEDRPAGSIGDVAGFSFYPGKNLGAFGDAGGITTSDSELARRIRRLRDHGRASKYEHSELGFNHRMDGLQGAVLDVKLGHLDDWNNQRRRNAEFYRSGLADRDSVNAPREADPADHVYHQFVVRVGERDRVLEELHDRDIGAGVHYPVPLHRQPSLQFLGYERGDFPVAERAAEEVLSLPVHSLMSQEQRSFVLDQFLEILAPSRV